MRNIEIDYDNKTNEYSLYEIFKNGQCMLLIKSENIEDIDNKIHSIYTKKQKQLFHECNILLNKLNNLEELSKMDVKGFRYGDRVRLRCNDDWCKAIKINTIGEIKGVNKGYVQALFSPSYYSQIQDIPIDELEKYIEHV